MKVHRRVSKIEPATAAPRGPRVQPPVIESDSGIGNVTPNAGARRGQSTIGAAVLADDEQSGD